MQLSKNLKLKHFNKIFTVAILPNEFLIGSSFKTILVNMPVSMQFGWTYRAINGSLDFGFTTSIYI